MAGAITGLGSEQWLPVVTCLTLFSRTGYVSNNLLVELTPFINSGAIDLSNVPQSVIDTGRIGDGIYAVSIGMGGLAMIYNKTLTDSLGITVPDNMTIDQFVEISRRIYGETGVRANVVYGDPSNPLEVFLRAKDIVMLSADGMGGTVEDYFEFFEFLEQGITEGWHIRPAHMVGRQGTEQDPLVYGSEPNQQSWVGFNFSNQLTSFANAAAEGTELAMTTYPSSNPGRSNFVRSSMYFSISAHGNNQDAAAALINFWVNSVDANRIMLGERGVPTSTVVADAIASDMTPVGVQIAEFVGMVANNSTPVNPPRPGAASEIIEQLRILTEAVGNGTMTGQAAAAEFFSFGNEVLAR
jgi:multiple sugar transport system substrate-binding protein